MFIVDSYALAVIFCFITMLCWGSWGNTQKLAARSWRYELFYWDYVVGVLLFSLIAAFTLGSIGNEGRSFLSDLKQADGNNMLSAFIGGIVFNASNILLSAAIAIAGMSVAFPVGVGIALVLGVVVNYIGSQKGDPLFLFLGVALIVIAIILNAMAYKLKGDAQKSSTKGIMISVIAGVLMAFFYRFIAASMDLDNFQSPEAGKMTPYTAVFIFSTGIFVSNFVFNTLLMKKPFTGAPVSYKDYFKGNFSTHLTGILGGMIWGLGNSLNLIAAGKAGAAISYGLGQGATMVAALWGVFIWKEFKGSKANVNGKLALMFLLFMVGIALIIMAGN
ncbi:MAG TPA: GRP family sugar transporter [Niabella sp.]|nr:GRP family sugar transporter [Niabella sp.]